MGIPVQIEVEATHVSGMINIYIFAWQMSFMLCVCHAPRLALPLAIHCWPELCNFFARYSLSFFCLSCYGKSVKTDKIAYFCMKEKAEARRDDGAGEGGKAEEVQLQMR